MKNRLIYPLLMLLLTFQVIFSSRVFADTITVRSQAFVNPMGSDFVWSYFTFGVDSNATSGQPAQIIIYDFQGLIGLESIEAGTTSAADWDFSSPLVGPVPEINSFPVPVQDDPIIPNLVFTYIGQDQISLSGQLVARFNVKSSLSDVGTSDWATQDLSFGTGNPSVAFGTAQTPTPVPIPSTMLLFGLGFAAFAFWRRREEQRWK